MTDRIILNIEDWGNATLAVRAARYLIDNPEKPDCLLEFESSSSPRMWAKRGKSAIIVYEQPARLNGEAAHEAR
ncbi:hypothetical protein [Sphingobium sp. YC-XJ3]|uniref:hypothetical protein n=1 Tax=Sphingobium sp. YC-XJ3 TaxID=3024245 RepID=UPI00235F4BF7|nr:hypothetical protein [Sphingobium sp. YC-XJ3]WDA36386.1 hypothetical protein PO876_23655 [Sphingobium sp. YC-XJ3]